MRFDEFNDALRKSRYNKQLLPFPELNLCLGDRDYSLFVDKNIIDDKDNVKYFSIRLENEKNNTFCDVVFACKINGDEDKNEIVLIFVYDKSLLNGAVGAIKTLECLKRYSLDDGKIAEEAVEKWH